MASTKHLTLVSLAADAEERWQKDGISAIERLIHVRNINTTQEAVRASLGVAAVRIERVIIDDASVDAVRFIRFVTSLPEEFRGDVLYIAGENSAFLSSATRDGGRAMYELDDDDVRFYAAANGLVERHPDAPADSTCAQNLVLIADDDGTAREALTRAVLRTGAEVVLASTGHEAIGLAGALRPALLFVSRELPDTHSVELVRAVRRLDAHYEPAISVLSQPLDLGAVARYVGSRLVVQGELLAS